MSNREETKEKVQKAINRLKKTDKKFTISQIAKEANIERKTLYNNPALLEMSKQAVNIQNSKLSPITDECVPQKSKRQHTFEERFQKLKENLAEEREKNAKLLHQNRELTLTKHNLETKIEYLESKLAQKNVIKVNK